MGVNWTDQVVDFFKSGSNSENPSSNSNPQVSQSSQEFSHQSSLDALSTDPNLTCDDSSQVNMSYAEQAAQLGSLSQTNQSALNASYSPQVLDEMNSTNNPEEAFYISEQSRSSQILEYGPNFVPNNSASEEDFQARSSLYGFEVNNTELDEIDQVYARADTAIQSKQEEIFAHYEAKTQGIDWYQKEKWVYQNDRELRSDRRQLNKLDELIESKEQEVQSLQSELVTFASEGQTSRQANQAFLQTEIGKAEELNNQMVILQNERNEIQARLGFYDAQRNALAKQEEIQTGMDDIQWMLSAHESELMMDPYAQDNSYLEEMSSGITESWDTPSLAADVDSSLEALDLYIAEAERFNPELAADLYVKRAEVYDKSAAHDLAGADLQKAEQLHPNSENLINYQQNLRPQQLESSIAYHENQLANLEQEGLADIDPRQIQKVYYLQAIKRAQTELGDEGGLAETQERLQEAQAWAKRSRLNSRLQAHAQSGLLNPQNAEEFGLSTDQFSKFFEFKEGNTAPLEYSNYLNSHPEVQDEKLPRVLAKLDQKQANLNAHLIADQQANPYTALFYKAKANYQEGITENKAHLVNLSEVQLDDFLKSTQEGTLNPQLSAMRQEALSMSRQLGLQKVDRIRQLAAQHDAGVQLHETDSDSLLLEFMAGHVSKAMHESNYQTQKKHLAQMEEALKSGEVNSFDEASHLISPDSMTRDSKRWVAFHRLHPDSTIQIKGEKALPSVSERLTPKLEEQALSEFASHYDSNHEVFVAQSVTREKIIGSRDSKLLGDEEVFVSRYKEEKLSYLMQENKESEYAYGSESISGTSGESYEEGFEQEAWSNDYYHSELEDFVRKNGREDIRFPQEPNVNHIAEDYNGILEAMARKEYADLQKEDRYVLENMPDSVALRDYIEEFDPLDEVFNLRRGSKTLIAKEGTKIATELAAGGVVGAGVGAFAEGAGQAMRAYRLQRNIRNMQRISSGLETAKTAGTLSRAAELGISATEKGINIAGDLAFNVATGQPLGWQDFVLSGLGNSFSSTKKIARNSGKVKPGVGGKILYEEVGGGDLRKARLMTEAEFNAEPPVRKLFDQSGNPLPATRQNVLQVSKEVGGEVGIIHEPGKKPYLVTNGHPGFVGDYQGRGPRGHAHNPPFRIVDEQGNNLGGALSYAPSEADISAMRYEIAQGTRKPHHSEYIHANTPQDEATTFAYRPISDSELTVYYKVSKFGNEPFRVLVDDQDLERLAFEMEEILKDPKITNIQQAIPILQNKGFQINGGKTKALQAPSS